MLFRKLLAFVSLFYIALALERSIIVYDAETEDLNEPSSTLLLLVSYLKSNNHETVLRAYTDQDLRISLTEDLAFDNVFLLPTSSKKIVNKKQLNKKNLLKVSEMGSNVVVVGDSQYNYPDEVREFLNEVGIYPSPKGYHLVDHFDPSDKVKLSASNIECTKILASIDGEYDGQTAIISNNEHLIPILSATKTSFSSNDNINPVSDDNTWGIGKQSHIIVGLQTLSGSRVTWLGSMELLSEQLLSWSTGARNILKLQFVQHHKADEPENLDGTLYRIKDQVIYTIGVSELIDGEWQPYQVKTHADTLQLSFKMLDPYQRLNLTPLGEASSTENGPLDTYVYFANFTIPDQHGMFTFELDYKRPGLSYLVDKRIVAVRHLANDEYKRSYAITNSWFYIASAMFVVFGWLLFVVNFMYVSKVDKTKKDL